ncbi:hypothetical protein Y032_0076g1018 [Ancylostoma ceylanicum]|uniref:Uncharacterized protein n=1 Tax=Ancylostoma ceylanicum TaxID=53326 RepID=A0A016TVF0_9BILA|nr:hypothetical protein Y032_0076g1018 [Ancylostoma ceylanicum]
MFHNDDVAATVHHRKLCVASPIENVKHDSYSRGLARLTAYGEATLDIHNAEPRCVGRAARQSALSQ